MSSAKVEFKEENIIFSMVNGMWQSRCLATIVDLGIPEIVCSDSGNKPAVSVDEIAKRAGCSDSDQLYKIMRVMAQWGIGNEMEGKRFTANKAMEMLRRDREASMGHWVAYRVSDEHWLSTLNLPQAVKTGQPAFEIAHGLNLYTYKGDEETSSKPNALVAVNGRIVGGSERRREFDENHSLAMESLTRTMEMRGREDLYSVYPWASCGRIMDIGGGNGKFLASVLSQPGCENLHGILFDLRHVLEAGSVFEKQPSLRDRVAMVSGNVLEPFPESLRVDTITAKTFLSSFGESEIRTTIQGCSRILPKGEGRLLIIEPVAPEACDTGNNALANGYQLGFLTIHFMALKIGADCRSKSEWVALLENVAPEAGMMLRKVYETKYKSYNIFELVKCDGSCI